MAEDKKPGSYWLPVLIAAIPITVGILQYYSTRQTEFRKQFWEEQIVLYKEAADAASEIAMSPDLEAPRLREQGSGSSIEVRIAFNQRVLKDNSCS